MVTSSRPIGRLIKFVAILALIALVAPVDLQAQDVAVGSATATVLAVLAVTATSALAFGNVFQGVPASIANSNASAGVFQITGNGGSGISVYMQLPDYLATATGDDRLVLSFSTTDASVDTTANVAPGSFGSGWQNTNPHNFPAATVIGSPANRTAIFLGGSVYPTVDQTAGAYTADIVLTVAYTGT
jgi:hypothetical protein